MIGMLTLVTGCIQARGDRTEFGTIKSLNDLQGKYQNRAEGGPVGSSPIFLSMLLWPKEAPSHAEIETIEVNALDADSLVVRALSNRGVEKESIFSEGEQFSIVKGRIRLRWDFWIAGTRGEPFLGPTYERAELGIDRRGQGKYRKDGAAAGLIFMLIPVVMADSEDYRFPRIEP